MYYSTGPDLLDIMMLLFFLLIVITPIVIVMRRNRASSSQSAAAQQATSQKKAQIVEDIKATSTSRVVDAISILEDLSSTNQNYRQYAELIGTTQPNGGVVAPYSKREVAYYDLRCFKVEHVGGRDVETLIAHEKSIEPFWFNDGTSPQNVFVDLDSFGNDIILINSANRIEGPTSDFAKALGQATGSAGGTSSAYAMVGQWLKWRLHNGFSLGLRTLMPTPALAAAGAGAYAQVQEAPELPKLQFFAPRGMGGFGGPGMGGNPFGMPGMGGMGGFGGQNPFGGIGNLGGFLGGNLGGIGGPYGGHWAGTRTSGSGDIIAGLALGALLSTLNAPQSTTGGQFDTSSQFRGYRIVEDIVPLNYSVYCLGELYKNGATVTMARSTSSSYPSSFFATKPEAEVVQHLSGK